MPESKHLLPTLYLNLFLFGFLRFVCAQVLSIFDGRLFTEATLLGRDSDFEHPPRPGHRLHGIGAEVNDGLMDLPGVRFDRRCVGRQVRTDPHLRREYEADLKANGIASRMDPALYEKPEGVEAKKSGTASSAAG